jgi:DNA-binding NarL/FixJ family response regulator
MPQNIPPVTEIQYPTIIYYNDDHSKTPDCTKKISDALKVNYTCPSKWQELIQELESGKEYLLFHVDMISKSIHSTPEDFIDAIITVTRFMSLRKSLKIGVIITPTTSIDTIRSLQRSGVQGILLDLNYYSIEETVDGVNALINSIPYWPGHIISALPKTDKRPLNVYFRVDYAPYLNNVNREELESSTDMTIKCCVDWHELDEMLSPDTHQIVVHIDTIKHLNTTISETMFMLETRLKIANLSIPIGIGIEPTTTLREIKELKKAGVFGIIPTIQHWGNDEAIAAVCALRDRIPYWPKHIISTLPGNVKKPVQDDKVTLTGRQEQVFRLITERGSSNKVIARNLGISESTVKLHVTEIFKKYGVKNRTQLAVFSHTA